MHQSGEISGTAVIRDRAVSNRQLNSKTDTAEQTLSIELRNDSSPKVAQKKKPTQSHRWEKIGEVCIDSGNVLIVDPLWSEYDDGFVENGLTRQIFDHDNHCLAVASQTGMGDGFYPVFAEIVDDDRVLSLFISFLPAYTFKVPDADRIAEEERAFLESMTAPIECDDDRKPQTISDSSKKMISEAALEAMTSINAQRLDWLLYLRLHRLVTDEVPDPEQPGELIGVVKCGQAMDPIDLFPSWTRDRLRYRMRKLADAGLLIRKWTAEGYRIAIRFSNASTRKTVPLVRMEHFGWLRRPIQMPLPLIPEQQRKAFEPAVLPMAA